MALYVENNKKTWTRFEHAGVGKHEELIKYVSGTVV